MSDRHSDKELKANEAIMTQRAMVLKHSTRRLASTTVVPIPTRTVDA